MKLCKKIAALVIAAAMLCCCIPAFAAYEPEYPEVPEDYDGYVTFAVSALTMGWTYLIDPILVPIHEGESVAVVTERALDSLAWSYSYTGTIEEGFYLTGVGCYETEPFVPDYLMDEILAYPEWAEENFGYSFGEWTGAYDDDEMLSNFEYCTLSGWMYLDNDETPSDGADTHVVTAGHVYTWIFSIYGWGMDYGVSDGWGSFPLFDNPMEGVSRTRASEVLAELCADEYINEIMLDVAGEELIAFLNAFYDPTSSQELIDDTLAALLEALDPDDTVYELGDVNMDGVIDSSDALIIMRAALELVELTDAQAALADFNADGTVDLVDALLILRAAA